MPRAGDMLRDFQRLFGAGGRLYRAPGRVNLIGEHTDYNDGFVMPVALDLCVWVAAASRRGRKLAVHSADFSERRELDLDGPAPKATGHWSDYVWGVARALERAGKRLSGADLLIRGDVPIGAGLSSSAAVEVAAAYALLDLSGWEMDRPALAKLCQGAENHFVGARCGIMDQFVSCCGQAGRALLLDCRSLEYRLLPLRPGMRLVMCNSMVKHRLTAGQYNARHRECEAGVRILSRGRRGISALRDVSPEQLDGCRRDLSDAVYRRCRHVTSENVRVLAAARALARGDLPALGGLMAESHRSLRDDYEVSCAELDALVELAGRIEGVYGARMTGGGFGGCTVNLVAAGRVEDFKRAMRRGYERVAGRKPDIYVCEAAAGAGPVPEAERPQRRSLHV
jgi:galactokinase